MYVHTITFSPYIMGNNKDLIIKLIKTDLYKHYENTPIQISWKFHHQKLKIFR